MQRKHHTRRLLFCGLIAAFAAGCRQDQPNGTDTSATQQADPKQEAAVLAKLVMADKADGQEDKIVRKCPMCALAMDGSVEHTLGFRGYTIQFCSEHCVETFQADPVKNLLDLEPFLK